MCLVAPTAPVVAVDVVVVVAVVVVVGRGGGRIGRGRGREFYNAGRRRRRRSSTILENRSCCIDGIILKLASNQGLQKGVLVKILPY